VIVIRIANRSNRRITVAGIAGAPGWLGKALGVQVTTLGTVLVVVVGVGRNRRRAVLVVCGLMVANLADVGGTIQRIGPLVIAEYPEGGILRSCHAFEGDWPSACGRADDLKDILNVRRVVIVTRTTVVGRAPVAVFGTKIGTVVE